MPKTVGDAIKVLFPNTTLITNQLPTGEQTRESLSSWSTAPWFPTDVFAAAAYLLDTSGALGYFDPDPGQDKAANGPRLTIGNDDREECVLLGQQWDFGARDLETANTPPAVQDLWEQLLEEHAQPIRFSEGQATPDWWLVALKLLIVSDEASDSIGAVEELEEPAFWSAIRRRKIRKRDFKGVGGKYMRSPGSSPTFCMLADANIAAVFPKSRVSTSGCSLRNFTRNLSLLPPVGKVRCHWQLPATPLLDDDEMPIDILVIPFPYEIAAKSFKPMHDAPGSKWGNFAVEQTWLSEIDITKLATSLILNAKKDVESVNGVLLPEYSIDFTTFAQLCATLRQIEPKLEFVIAGTSTNCNPDEKNVCNHVMTCVWHRMNDPFGSGDEKTQVTRELMSSRRKHHRWMLSSDQLENYALTSTLDPRINWWENHEIGVRELHFHPFRKSSLFTAMICEDLARSDPCHEVLRSVGPNLVFVLLMDGPQIASRWAARYASTLSDDPGCSVLTLTSYGLVQRSNRSKFYPEQNAVGYFASPFGQTPIVLDYGSGARGVLLTLTSQRESELSTIDGREVADSRTWRLTSSQPVFEEVLPENLPSPHS